MITKLMTGLAGIVLLASAHAAQAAPVSIPAIDHDPGVVTVAGGCGPGGFRAPNGYCYPRRPPPPRRFGRPCPPGMHPTPYGCRRNF